MKRVRTDALHNHMLHTADKMRNMGKSILLLIMTTTALGSWGQSGSSSDSSYNQPSDSARTVQWPSQPEKNSFTRFEYAESIGGRIVIQNSFPKSGTHYTDPNGKKYVYAVFWTQVINETDSPFEVTLDFPADSMEIPSSSGRYMKLFLPADAMTIDKEPQYDYGLAIKSFLDANRNKPSSLKRTINPKDATAFYVVTLSTTGVEGALRAGLSKKGKNFFYTISKYTHTHVPSLINQKEIQCGSIRFNN